MSFLKKFKLQIIFVAIIALVFYLGFTTISEQNRIIGELQTKNQTLTTTVTEIRENVKEVTDSIKRDLDDQKRFNQQLRDIAEKNNTAIKKMDDMFNKPTGESVRRFRKLVEAKPSLMERRINQATQKLGISLEDSSTYIKEKTDEGN